MDLYDYKLTEIAKNDIDQSIKYIKEDLNNHSAAKKLYSKLLHIIENIKSNPRMYSDCSNYYIDNVFIRKAIIDNYVLIYEIDEKRCCINVLRFLYSHRNIVEEEL